MNHQEFDHLLELILENEASETEATRFEDLLKSDPALRKEAHQQLMIHGQLGIALEDEFSTEAFITHTTTAIKHEDQERFSQSVKAKIQQATWFKRCAGLVALAALLLAGMFIAKTLSSSRQSVEKIASVTRLDGVRWAQNPLTQGAGIKPGQTLQIDSGLVEVDLAGRGNLVIEGPAHLNFSSPMEAILHRGNVVMHATKKGHGYTISTSQGKIIDIGTEFAVSVDHKNTVETHVIKGSVEAITNNGKKITLKVNDALQFDHLGSRNIDADAGKFYTKMPPSHTSANYIHWSFDEHQGTMAFAKGELGKSESQTNELLFHAQKNNTLPRWIKGVHGSGLHFDGIESYAESEYQGVQGSEARTVCCWVKVPKAFSMNQGFGIVSWGNAKVPGETWQISVNPLKKDGAVGRLRLGLHGSQIIGTTDLRDGEWHHIAVVFYGGSTPKIGTQALLYVDGRKESVHRAALKKVKTNTKSDSHGVWVGRNATYEGNNEKYSHKFFRGSIDELYIFDVALSQKELQKIIQK